MDNIGDWFDKLDADTVKRGLLICAAVIAAGFIAAVGAVGYGLYRTAEWLGAVLG